MTDPIPTPSIRRPKPGLWHLPFLPLALLLATGSLDAQGMVDIDPRIQEIVAEISEENLEHLVTGMASFETRNTMSSVDDPDRGIGAAREWMVEELAGYSPRLQVGLDCYDVVASGRITRDVEICNVKAVLPGRTERRIYVSGHYDSLAQVPPGAEDDYPEHDNFAPGANDDASGTAVAMELARVLSQSGLEFDATLVFIGFAGEEQGLFGARLHAKRALDEGVQIDAVFNNDILGNIRAVMVRSTAPPSRCSPLDPTTLRPAPWPGTPTDSARPTCPITTSGSWAGKTALDGAATTPPSTTGDSRPFASPR
jgi:hypothetical protein